MKNFDEYKLVKSNDSILREKCKPFDFDNVPIDPLDLQDIFKHHLLDKNALGVSASQFGLPYRVFAIQDYEEKNVGMIFNPNIVNFSEETSMEEEGCLSYPGLYVKIRRSKEIRMRWTNQFGEVNTSKFSGVTARIFQHEYDHLNGIVFHSRANHYHLDLAKRKKRKLDKARKRLST